MSEYLKMQSGDMLQALADDAMKWADAFAELHPEVDKGTTVAWFANAIENAWDTRSSRFSRDDDAWTDFKDQVERHRKLWREISPS